MIPHLAPLTLAAALFVLTPSFARAHPVNDECAAATPLKKVPSTQTLGVETATIGASDPESSCNGGDPSVWYTYTAKSQVSLELLPTANTYRPGITVYTGECGALIERTCVRSDPFGEAPSVVLPLRKGDVVRIVVTTDPLPGSTLSLAVRTSDPRYRRPKSVAEIVRSADPSPYGGAQGQIFAAVATGARGPGGLSAASCTRGSRPGRARTRKLALC